MKCQDSMKEIGSFIELELPQGREYYSGEENIARLNSGRAAIYHACRVLNLSTLWLPYYQCGIVREFLTRKGIMLKYYEIASDFTPLDLTPSEDEAVLLVNYFGIFSEKLRSLCTRYKNVIVDHSQAFFTSPIPGLQNVYSPRKFFGVPDGAYLIGENAHCYVNDYPQSYSSDTASFLMERIEYGCEGKAYTSRQKNEERIDKEDVMRMSSLTRTLLDSLDYASVAHKRRVNYQKACDMFSSLNRIAPLLLSETSSQDVPMVYPLVVEDESLLDKLLRAKHFQGRWWQYLTQERPCDSFSHYLSRYMLPITIDQRYSPSDIEYIHHIITDHNE